MANEYNDWYGSILSGAGTKQQDVEEAKQRKLRKLSDEKRYKLDNSQKITEFTDADTLVTQGTYDEASTIHRMAGGVDAAETQHGEFSMTAKEQARISAQKPRVAEALGKPVTQVTNQDVWDFGEKEKVRLMVEATNGGKPFNDEFDLVSGAKIDGSGYNVPVDIESQGEDAYGRMLSSFKAKDTDFNLNQSALDRGAISPEAVRRGQVGQGLDGENVDRANIAKALLSQELKAQADFNVDEAFNRDNMPVEVAKGAASMFATGVTEIADLAADVTTWAAKKIGDITGLEEVSDEALANWGVKRRKDGSLNNVTFEDAKETLNGYLEYDEKFVTADREKAVEDIKAIFNDDNLSVAEKVLEIGEATARNSGIIPGLVADSAAYLALLGFGGGTALAGTTLKAGSTGAKAAGLFGNVAKEGSELAIKHATKQGTKEGIKAGAKHVANLSKTTRGKNLVGHTRQKYITKNIAAVGKRDAVLTAAGLPLAMANANQAVEEWRENNDGKAPSTAQMAGIVGLSTLQTKIDHLADKASFGALKITKDALGKIITKGGKEASQGLIKTLAKSIGKGALATAGSTALEGATELTQEAITMYAERFGTEKYKDKELLGFLDDESQGRLAAAGILGAGGGLGMAGAGAVAQTATDTRTPLYIKASNIIANNNDTFKMKRSVNRVEDAQNRATVDMLDNAFSAKPDAVKPIESINEALNTHKKELNIGKADNEVVQGRIISNMVSEFAKQAVQKEGGLEKITELVQQIKADKKLSKSFDNVTFARDMINEGLEDTVFRANNETVQGKKVTEADIKKAFNAIEQIVGSMPLTPEETVKVDEFKAKAQELLRKYHETGSKDISDVASEFAEIGFLNVKSGTKTRKPLVAHENDIIDDITKGQNPGHNIKELKNFATSRINKLFNKRYLEGNNHAPKFLITIAKENEMLNATIEKLEHAAYAMDSGEAQTEYVEQIKDIKERMAESDRYIKEMENSDTEVKRTDKFANKRQKNFGRKSTATVNNETVEGETETIIESDEEIVVDNSTPVSNTSAPSAETQQSVASMRAKSFKTTVIKVGTNTYGFFFGNVDTKKKGVSIGDKTRLLGYVKVDNRNNFTATEIPMTEEGKYKYFSSSMFASIANNLGKSEDYIFHLKNPYSKKKDTAEKQFVIIDGMVYNGRDISSMTGVEKELGYVPFLSVKYINKAINDTKENGEIPSTVQNTMLIALLKHKDLDKFESFMNDKKTYVNYKNETKEMLANDLFSNLFAQKDNIQATPVTESTPEVDTSDAESQAEQVKELYEFLKSNPIYNMTIEQYEDLSKKIGELGQIVTDPTARKGLVKINKIAVQRFDMVTSSPQYKDSILNNSIKKRKADKLAAEVAYTEKKKKEASTQNPEIGLNTEEEVVVESTEEIVTTEVVEETVETQTEPNLYKNYLIIEKDGEFNIYTPDGEKAGTFITERAAKGGITRHIKKIAKEDVTDTNVRETVEQEEATPTLYNSITTGEKDKSSFKSEEHFTAVKDRVEVEIELKDTKTEAKTLWNKINKKTRTILAQNNAHLYYAEMINELEDISKMIAENPESNIALEKQSIEDTFYFLPNDAKMELRSILASLQKYTRSRQIDVLINKVFIPKLSELIKEANSKETLEYTADMKKQVDAYYQEKTRLDNKATQLNGELKALRILEHNESIGGTLNNRIYKSMDKEQRRLFSPKEIKEYAISIFDKFRRPLTEEMDFMEMLSILPESKKKLFENSETGERFMKSRLLLGNMIAGLNIHKVINNSQPAGYNNDGTIDHQNGFIINEDGIVEANETASSSALNALSFIAKLGKQDGAESENALSYKLDETTTEIIGFYAMKMFNDAYELSLTTKDEDIIDVFGLGVEADAFDIEYGMTKLRQGVIPRSSLISMIGKDIYAALGISSNYEIDNDVEEMLISQLGMLASDVLLDAGLFNASEDQIKFEIGGIKRELDGFRFNTFKPNNIEKGTEQHIQHNDEIQSQLRQAVIDFSHLIPNKRQNVVNSEPNTVAPDTVRNNSAYKTSEATKEKILENQAQEWRYNGMVDLLLDIKNKTEDGITNLYKMAGWKELSELHPIDIKAQESVNRQIENDFNDMFTTYDEYGTDNGMYFNWDFTKSGRYMLDGNINPQGSKIFRFVMQIVGKNKTEGMIQAFNPDTDADNLTLFKLALGQALDLGLDKKADKTVLSDLEDVITFDGRNVTINPKNELGQILQSAVNYINDSKTTTDGHLAGQQALVDLAMEGENMHAVQAAYEIARLIKTPDREFTTGLMIEADAITSGMALTLLQIGSKTAQDLLKKTGIYTDEVLGELITEYMKAHPNHKENIKDVDPTVVKAIARYNKKHGTKLKPMNITHGILNEEKWFEDFYTDIGMKVVYKSDDVEQAIEKSALSPMSDGKPNGIKSAGALGLLFKHALNDRFKDENGNYIQKKIRAIAKSPVMVFIYGSSLNSIRKGIARIGNPAFPTIGGDTLKDMVTDPDMANFTYEQLTEPFQSFSNRDLELVAMKQMLPSEMKDWGTKNIGENLTYEALLDFGFQKVYKGRTRAQVKAMLNDDEIFKMANKFVKLGMTLYLASNQNVKDKFGEYNIQKAKPAFAKYEDGEFKKENKKKNIEVPHTMAHMIITENMISNIQLGTDAVYGEAFDTVFAETFGEENEYRDAIKIVEVATYAIYAQNIKKTLQDLIGDREFATKKEMRTAVASVINAGMGHNMTTLDGSLQGLDKQTNTSSHRAVNGKRSNVTEKDANVRAFVNSFFAETDYNSKKTGRMTEFIHKKKPEGNVRAAPTISIHNIDGASITDSLRGMGVLNIYDAFGGGISMEQYDTVTDGYQDSIMDNSMNHSVLGQNMKKLQFMISQLSKKERRELFKEMDYDEIYKSVQTFSNKPFVTIQGETMRTDAEKKFFETVDMVRTGREELFDKDVALNHLYAVDKNLRNHNGKGKKTDVPSKTSQEVVFKFYKELMDNLEKYTIKLDKKKSKHKETRDEQFKAAEGVDESTIETKEEKPKEPVNLKTNDKARMYIAGKIKDFVLGKTNGNALIATKDAFKASMSNKFIGFGAPGSSTNAYKNVYNHENFKAANTGKYEKDDIVFVSVNGKGKGRVEPTRTIKGKLALKGGYAQIDNALNAGASIIADSKTYLAGSEHNVGEKALQAYFEQQGYLYEEISIKVGDKDVSVGKWTKPEPKKEDTPDNDQVNGEDVDPLYKDAVKAILRDRKTTTGFLQRVLHVGYTRADSIMKQIIKNGVVLLDEKTGIRTIPDIKGSLENQSNATDEIVDDIEFNVSERLESELLTYMEMEGYVHEDVNGGLQISEKDKKYATHISNLAKSLANIVKEAKLDMGVKVSRFYTEGRTRGSANLSNNHIDLRFNTDGDSMFGVTDTFMHEVLHVLTNHALEMKPAIRAKIRDVQEQVKAKVGYHAFLPADEQWTSDDIAIAKELYDYVLEGDEAEFVSYSMTNPHLYKAIADIEVQTNLFNELKGESTFATIMNKFIGVINKIYSATGGLGSRNAQDAMRNLTEDLATIQTGRLAEAIVENDENAEKGMFQALFNVVDKKMLKHNDKINEKIASIAKSADIKLRGSTLLERVSEIKGLQLIKQTQFFQDIYSELVESTSDEKVYGAYKLFNKVKKIQETDKEKLRTSLDSNLDELLQGTTDGQRKAIKRVLVDTDVTTLSKKKGYGLPMVEKLLSDEKFLDEEIARVRAGFGNTQDAYDFMEQAQGLGYYMVHNESPVSNQMKNANNIYRKLYKGDAFIVRGEIENNQTVENIDTLATLYGLKYSGKESKELAAEALDTHEEGIKTVLNTFAIHMKQYNDELFETVGRFSDVDNKAKGYTYGDYHENKKMVIVKEEDVKYFEMMKMKVVREVDEFLGEGITEKRYVMIGDNIDSTYNKGMMDIIGFGSTGLTLREMAQQSGQVEEEVVQTIEQMKKNNSGHKASGKELNMDPKKMTMKLMPKFDLGGNIVDYASEMNHNDKVKYMTLNDDVVSTVSNTITNTSAKHSAIHSNTKVIDYLLNDSERNYRKNPDEFVVIEPSRPKDGYISPTEKQWAIIPQYTKDYIANKTNGSRQLIVRKRLINDVFGYRSPSMANIGNMKEKHPRFYRAVRVLEKFWMSVISKFKGIIVTLTSPVVFGNMVSNMFFAAQHGVDPISFAKSTIEAWKLLDVYTEDQKELSKLEILQKGGVKVNQGRINGLKKKLEKNPMHEFIERGMFSPIVEDINISAKREHSDIDKFIDKMSSKMPKPIAGFLDQIYINEGTLIHKTMFKMIQYGDITARYAIKKNLEKDGKMTEEQQWSYLDELLVNYGYNENKYLRYFNDIGALMFTKYFLRTPKAIVKMMKNNPTLTTLFQGVQYGTGIDVIDPLDTFVNPIDAIFNRIGNPLDVGAEILSPNLPNLLFSFGDFVDFR